MLKSVHFWVVVIVIGIIYSTFPILFRPTSLAWEVRKMSPGRHVMPNPSTDRMVTSPGARRTLNFRQAILLSLITTYASWLPHHCSAFDFMAKDI